MSESKHGVGASLLTKNELGSIPSRTANQWGEPRAAALPCKHRDYKGSIPWSSTKFYAWLVKWYNQTLPTFSQEFDSLTPHQFLCFGSLMEEPCFYIAKMGVQFSNEVPSLGLKVFMDAHKPVTLEEGDRYPLGPPSLSL